MSDDRLSLPFCYCCLLAYPCGWQAALSCFLTQQRKHAGPDLFDWSSVCTKAYISVVDRLLPQVDVDLDALDDEEQMSASKERRNLIDVFMEKRRGVSSLKLRTLLKVNALTFGTLKKYPTINPPPCYMYASACVQILVLRVVRPMMCSLYRAQGF